MPKAAGVYTDLFRGQGIAEGCEENAVSYLFLDIDMPKPNGIELAEMLRRESPGEDELIIYVSSFDDMVYQTFHINPFAFIRKTHLDEELGHIVERILNYFEKNRKDGLVFETDGKLIALSSAQVQYIESFDKTQIIHTEKSSFTISGKLGELETRLKPYGFLRVHKSYLVNYRFISSIESQWVVLDNGERITLSKHRAKEIRKEYFDLITGGSPE